MASDIIAASKGGTYAIIQTEWCVFIPDESANVSSLLSHMRRQVKVLSYLTSSLAALNQWFRSWALGGKNCYSGCHYLDLCFLLQVPLLLLWYLPHIQPDRLPTSHFHASKTPSWLFREYCWRWECVRVSWRLECWGRSLRGCDRKLTWQLNLCYQRLLTCSLFLKCSFAHHSRTRTHFKDIASREYGIVETIWTVSVIEPS